jgi:phage gp36-like protein
MDERMLSGSMEALLQETNADAVTEYFLLALSFCLMVALFCTWKGKWPRFVAYAPTLLTSLGILGTFVGIVVGLMDFDPTKIDESIAGLLAGLKTAFITSLAGMGTGIVLKTLTTTPLFTKSETADTAEDVGPEDVLRAIQDQNALLVSLRDAIAKDEESSLGGQIRLMRADLSDHHKASVRSQNEFAEKLWQQLTDFAEMLSKSATEQVILALKEVIADFNRNLTEQFGENFKALDASVKKLVEWQEQYRLQLQDLHRLYGHAVEGMQQMETSVTSIAESTKAIPPAMEQLTEIVTAAKYQLDDLERHLEVFKAMRDAAVQAVPEIRGQVQQTMEDIKGAVDDATEHYTKLLDLTDDYAEAQDQKAQEMLKVLTEAGATLEADVAKLQQAIDGSVQAMQSGVANSMERITEGVAQVHTQMQSDIEETLQAQSRATDQASESFQHAVDGSVESMQRGVADSMERITDGVSQVHAQMQGGIEETLQAQSRATHQAVEGFREEMERAMARTGEGVNAQLNAMDEAMRAELERVISEMGQSLARIAGKFTEDYSQLTAAMQQIVEQARRER